MQPRQVVAVAHPLELALHITLPLLIRDEIGQRMQQGVIIPIGFRVIHADEPAAWRYGLKQCVNRHAVLEDAVPVFYSIWNMEGAREARIDSRLSMTTSSRRSNIFCQQLM